MAENEKLPNVLRAEIGKARVIEDGERHIVELAIEDKASEHIVKKSIQQAICALCDVVIELNLHFSRHFLSPKDQSIIFPGAKYRI